MDLTNREKIRLITVSRQYFDDDRIKKAFLSEYNKQAIDFLLETKTKCTIDFIGLSFPENWESKSQVNRYSVTLQNEKHSYTFNFYDSIHNTEKKKSLRLDFYSVLACLNSYYPEDFDEFISDFGYEMKPERDYVRLKKIHFDCLDESRALRKLFSSEELEKLAEIN